MSELAKAKSLIHLYLTVTGVLIVTIFREGEAASRAALQRLLDAHPKWDKSAAVYSPRSSFSLSGAYNLLVCGDIPPEKDANNHKYVHVPSQDAWSYMPNGLNILVDIHENNHGYVMNESTSPEDYNKDEITEDFAKIMKVTEIHVVSASSEMKFGLHGSASLTGTP